MAKKHSLIWSVLLPPLLAGCAGEVLGGGMTEAELFAVGDGGSQGAAPANSAAPPSFAADLDAAAAPRLAGLDLEGTITFDARAWLVDDGGTHVLVTPGSTATLRIEEPDSSRFASRLVPPARYRWLRLEFTRVEAAVEAGLIIGGLPGPELVRVGIPAGGSLLMDVPVELTAGGVPLRLVLDLNASAWLPTADPATGIVSPQNFKTAVRVRVR